MLDSQACWTAATACSGTSPTRASGTNVPEPLTRTVPTAAERTGDFSRAAQGRAPTTRSTIPPPACRKARASAASRSPNNIIPGQPAQPHRQELPAILPAAQPARPRRRPGQLPRQHHPLGQLQQRTRPPGLQPQRPPQAVLQLSGTTSGFENREQRVQQHRHRQFPARASIGARCWTTSTPSVRPWCSTRALNWTRFTAQQRTGPATVSTSPRWASRPRWPRPRRTRVLPAAFDDRRSFTTLGDTGGDSTPLRQVPDLSSLTKITARTA